MFVKSPWVLPTTVEQSVSVWCPVYREIPNLIGGLYGTSGSFREAKLRTAALC